MTERYNRNIPAISEEQQETLLTKSVFIAGLGGLGGYLLEYALRLGVGKITCADFDRFTPSNLNRQLLSTEENLGKSKAEAAMERAKAVNSGVLVNIISVQLTEDNCEELIKGSDIILDGLDSAEGKLMLAGAASRLGLTVIHGAVGGLCCEAAVIRPGSGLLKRIYGAGLGSKDAPSPSFVPPFCAAIQISECVKALLGQESNIEGKLLIADIGDMDIETITII